MEILGCFYCKIEFFRTKYCENH